MVQHFKGKMMRGKVVFSSSGVRLGLLLKKEKKRRREFAKNSNT
jgi:hypothetical protein